VPLPVDPRKFVSYVAFGLAVCDYQFRRVTNLQRNDHVNGGVLVAVGTIIIDA